MLGLEADSPQQEGERGPGHPRRGQRCRAGPSTGTESGGAGTRAARGAAGAALTAVQK